MVALVLLVVGGLLAGWGWEAYCGLRRRRPMPHPLGFEQARTYVTGADEVERWILAGGSATLDEYLADPSTTTALLGRTVVGTDAEINHSLMDTYRQYRQRMLGHDTHERAR